MASDLMTSWDHSGFGNNNNIGAEDVRFGNGSISNLDQSLKDKSKRQSGVRLKDPPSGSYPKPGHRRLASEAPRSSSKDAGYGEHRRMVSEGGGGDGGRGGEIPKKLPPDPRYKGGDFYQPYTKGGGSEAFVFDSIPSSPMRTKSTKRDSKAPVVEGDSTTCEETRSVSDNSSSMQSPTSSEAGRQSGSSKGSPRPMNDVSGLTYPRRSGKDPPIPRSVESRREKDVDPPIPRSVEPRFDNNGMVVVDRSPPRHISGRRDKQGGGRDQGFDHSRRSRHYDDDPTQPPPLAPYEDEYAPPQSNRYDHGYYGRPEDSSRRDYDDVSGFHDSRSRMHDRSSRYDDDNVSRMSRSSRYHDDRSRYNDGGYGGGGYHRPPPSQDRYHYDDSRSSRYHHHQDNRSLGGGSRMDDDAVSRPGRYPGERHHHHHPEDDDARSRSSYMSASHPSRYMDRATRYHHPRPDRYYEDSSRYHGQHPHHHPHHQPYQQQQHRGYDDERSRGGGDERSRYHDRDRDDGSTIVTSYTRYDRQGYHHETYTSSSREGPYPPRSSGNSRPYDREDPYLRGGEDPYNIRPDPRSGDGGGLYGRSGHSRGSSSLSRGSSHHSRDHDYRRRDPYHREQPHHQSRPEDDGYGDRGSGSGDGGGRSRYQEDDLYEAKMRAYGTTGANGHNDDGGGGSGASGGRASLKAPPGEDNSKEGEVMVDIGFGTKARLRRTKETMDAISRDFYAPATCFACSTELFCIADVQYIVCPKCKTISPAEQAAAAGGAGGTATSFDGKPMHRHGVGLGFTYETLFRMQSDVLQKRGERRATKTGY